MAELVDATDSTKLPKARLTDISVKSFKPKSSQVTYWDETLPSFGCRVSPGGIKTFTLMYGESRRRVTIGRYPTLSLSKALTKAKEYLAEIMLGNHSESIAFDRALELFLTTHCKVKNKARTAYETERLLRRHFLPVFGQRSLEDILTRDIAAINDRLLSTPSECNHAFTAIRTFFRWAYRRKYVDYSPCDGLQHPTKPVARSRVLSDEELPLIYQAADQLGTYGAIVKLLVLTGQRLSEIAKLEGNT